MGERLSAHYIIAASTAASAGEFFRDRCGARAAVGNFAGAPEA
jgi:hypothetical protein